MRGLWVLVLITSVLIAEVLACWLDMHGYPFERAYRVFHLLQMLTLIVLAVMAFRQLEQGTFWQRISMLILAGLCFSFVGDLINSHLVDLTSILKPQALLSTVPFVIAHCLYIASFWKIARSGHSPISGRLILASLLLWPVLAAGLWQLLVDSSAGPVIRWLSFGYAHMVVLMALTSLWPLQALGRIAWVAAAGGLLFLFSDAFFGAWLMEGAQRPFWVSQTIWATYFLAQLGIAQVPLMRRLPA